MKTWTVRYTAEDGQAAQLAPMPEDEAKALRDEVSRTIYPDAVTADLLAELRARLPLGARVRHTSTGEVGTVVEQDASGAPASGAPAGTRIAHYVGYGHEAVSVEFEGRGYPLWIVADYFELAEEVR